LIFLEAISSGSCLFYCSETVSLLRLSFTLIGELLPYVTHSIWIGKMNHLGRFGKGSEMVLQQAIKKIKRGQTNSIIKSIYNRHKTNPQIKWKKEIKKIVGIPLPSVPGMDI